MSDTIRVLVVDDHPVVRKGIVAMIDTEPGLEVIGECSNGLEAVQRTVQLHPDVILMDLVMPEMGGVEAIQTIKSRLPDARILVLTSFSTQNQVLESLQAGAMGYLLKDSDPAELIKAIRHAYHGEASLDPSVTRQVLSQISNPKPSAPSPLEDLTEREVEVLRYVARGLTNQQIAQLLVVSEATVHTHVSKILSKLHLSSRTQAALFALRQGLISLDSLDGMDQPG